MSKRRRGPFPLKGRFEECLFVPGGSDNPPIIGPHQFRAMVESGTINERGWWYRTRPPKSWIDQALAAMGAR